MKAFLFWIMGRNLGLVKEWLHKNPEEVEHAYDRLILEEIGSIPKAQGWIKLPFHDTKGVVIGELDVDTGSLLAYLDYGRRRISNARYSFALECYYQWLYRFEPGLNAVVIPKDWLPLAAKQICEADGSISFIARCMRCHNPKPDIRIGWGSRGRTDYRAGGAIVCSCGAIFHQYQYQIHFNIAHKD